jgi:hypothetical protein
VGAQLSSDRDAVEERSTRAQPASRQRWQNASGCPAYQAFLEIVASAFVALKPRYGAYVVAAWLGGIIVDLLTYSGYYDIALRYFA